MAICALTGKVREERMAEEEEKHRPELMRKGREVGRLAFCGMRVFHATEENGVLGSGYGAALLQYIYMKEGSTFFEAAAFL